MAGKPRTKAGPTGKASGASASAAGGSASAAGGSASSATAAAASSATAAATQASAGKLAAKDLAARLADPKFQADVEAAVRDLPPEKAAELVAMLEASMRKRKIELYGYLAAAAIVIVGMIGALLVMGSVEEGTFIGWVFLVPLGLAGIVMMLVGRRARADQKASAAALAGRQTPRRPS